MHDMLTLQEALARNLDDAAPDAVVAMIDTMDAIAQACARISDLAGQGVLAGAHGLADSANSQGEAQKKLDVLSDEIMSHHLGHCEHVAGWASEEHEHHQLSDKHVRNGRYLVVYDPLDGSSNIEANISIGTIFSILPHEGRGRLPTEDSYRQPGHEQLAAGYVLYGPATIMVLTCRRGVLMFTLDKRSGANGEPMRWLLTQEAVQIPMQTKEFAINASNQRFWEKPVQRYIAECTAGENGPRMKDFNMRWVASMVAEVHRIMTRGGVFMYPRDTREPRKPGRLRLMYEASPMALLVEQAGGRAVNGTSELLDLVPDTLHQRVPVILGSREEIDRIVSYHADPHENVSWQLFKTRSLFVQPQA
ncbi:class 1 fructose-bisphosphatase [Aquabacterium sp.]|uniref:class 1 fructose-bisphosphatase n=1 Tax=Aquabacterium sp. TaxID=1872578 RepID=UPI0025BA6C7C|nr:class 1 fructose-bisphosphatase [Aquabacterium sp.]